MEKRLTQVLLFMIVILALAGCRTNQTIEQLDIGISAYENSDLMVKIVFDDKFSPPAGAIGCCWGNAQKKGSFWGAEIPHKVDVEWRDYKQAKLYRASFKVQRKKAYHIIDELTPVTFASGRVDDDVNPFIIFGFGEGGEVKMWISNSAFAGVKGRILEEIGSAQATWEPFELTDEMFN
ncbi:DUF2931 domain-containing protein [Pseudoalteromonas piscicida]|uniref:DUF2931 domain-containing protein n=2 Tax=Pseudoalteromonas TaxID=53246 RepID=A0AAQ2EWU4_PSEO7|nr:MULTISPECIES: DUF2931 family protein [Pseudoalteromonas]KJY85841.1 hypothetical protein TW75_18685 [Pseudoalteromonas piscicida]MCG7553306.1 DUF2931 family protein [Pseudoalteromonas sp. Of11M-6]TMN41818.1 DUF2931 domain-containing protein [Pseudoalteromonas piscicida]TMN44353.1 DUF2931 domain-containing protein [Pseudoalteromonas piscicida]TMN48156.1 DUF2931 domain-containing protein [Pseudoalteromonas piscicida]